MSSFNSTTRSLYRIVLFSMVFLLVLTAALSVVARVSLPLMSGYKGSLESRLGQYLGTPVSIGSLSLAWEGVGPVVKANQVSIIESDERRVSVSSILLDVNLARSVLTGGPAINELTLVGADLYIEYSGAGEFTVHGVPTEKSEGSTGAASSGRDSGLDGLSWLTQARRVGLLDTSITLIDTTDGRRLSIQDLNLRAENRGDAHQLRLDLLLPDTLGQRMEAGIDFSGSDANLSDTQGQFYINADSLNMKGWQRLIAGSLKRGAPADHLESSNEDELPKVLWENALKGMDADGSLEVWGKWLEGEVTTARGELAVTDLVNVDDDEPLLDSLSFDLAYKNTNPGWQLTAQHLTLEHEQNATIIDELVLQRGSRTSGHWSVEAAGDRLQMESLSVLPTAMLSAAGHPAGQWLRDAAPGGLLSDWMFDVSLANGEPTITAKGHFEDLFWQANDLLPGLDALSGRVAIDDNEGSVILRGQKMALNAPKDLAAPVLIDALDATFDVVLSRAQGHVVKGQVAMTDEGVEFSTRVSTEFKQGQSPHLDLQGRFKVADISRVPDLLPIRRLGPATGRWFKQALQGGRAENGRFILFGDLDDFPFNSKEGVFSASFDVRDGKLKSLPNWPVSTGIDGRVELNGLSLTGKANKGRLDTMEVSQAVARIADLSRPVLTFESTGSGPLQSMVDFGNTGPLSPWLKPALSGLTGTGEVSMDLELRVPLVKSRYKDSPFKVSGSVFMNDNDISFDGANVALGKAKGAVGFSHTGISINNLRGLFLDQAVVVDGWTTGKGNDAVTTLSVVGAIEAKSLLEHFDIPLERFVNGPSRWEVTLEAPHSSERAEYEGLRLVATSDLVGTALQLPVPMAKGSASAGTMRLETAILEGQASSLWSIDYGDQMHALVSGNDEGMEALSVRFGGEYPDPQLRKGIHIDGSTSGLSLDGWVTSVSELIDDLPDSGELTPMLPISADLGIETLIAGVTELGAARIRATTDESFLNAVIENQTLSGQMTYPREYWRRDVTAQIQLSHVDKRLIDALQSGPESDEADTGGLDPRLLPPLDVNIANLEWDQLALSDVSMRTQPDVSGLVIETLGFAYRNLRLVGSGEWFLLDPQGVNPELEDEHSTRLSLALQSDDFGRGLSQVGFPDAMADGEGRVGMELNWPGPAYLPELERMDGSVTMDIRRGRIRSVDPGAGGKLVGLFALQALPQRLSFDFSDVVSDGLGFQKITGNIALEDGVADATLVQLSGPVGVVDITGTTDLVNEQYNQRITVLPRVSAALPIIGMIAGGASAGIGALVAGGFLKALGLDIDRIGLREYQLEGSWDEPNLVPLE